MDGASEAGPFLPMVFDEVDWLVGWCLRERDDDEDDKKSRYGMLLNV